MVFSLKEFSGGLRMLGPIPLAIPMRAFQAAFGRQEFPNILSEYELRQWFTFDERDRRSIRKPIRSRYWIGAALHCDFWR